MLRLRVSHPFTVVMGPEEGFINQYERMADMKGVNYAHATV